MIIVIKLKEHDDEIDIIGLKEQLAACLDGVADIERFDVYEETQEGESEHV